MGLLHIDYHPFSYLICFDAHDVDAFKPLQAV